MGRGGGGVASCADMQGPVFGPLSRDRLVGLVVKAYS